MHIHSTGTILEKNKQVSLSDNPRVLRRVKQMNSECDCNMMKKRGRRPRRINDNVN